MSIASQGQLVHSDQQGDSTTQDALESSDDEDLAEDFLEGCIWGMGLGALHTANTCDLGALLSSHQPAPRIQGQRAEGTSRCETLACTSHSQGSQYEQARSGARCTRPVL